MTVFYRCICVQTEFGRKDEGKDIDRIRREKKTRRRTERKCKKEGVRGENEMGARMMWTRRHG